MLLGSREGCKLVHYGSGELDDGIMVEVSTYVGWDTLYIWVWQLYTKVLLSSTVHM